MEDQEHLPSGQGPLPRVRVLTTHYLSFLASAYSASLEPYPYLGQRALWRKRIFPLPPANSLRSHACCSCFLLFNRPTTDCKKSEPEKFGKRQRSDAQVKAIAALDERLTNQWGSRYGEGRKVRNFWSFLKCRVATAVRDCRLVVERREIASQRTMVRFHQTYLGMRSLP